VWEETHTEHRWVHQIFCPLPLEGLFSVASASPVDEGDIFFGRSILSWHASTDRQRAHISRAAAAAD
jgi:hypothetical protein